MHQFITAAQHADLIIGQSAYHYGAAHIGGRWTVNVAVNAQGENALTIADDL